MCENLLIDNTPKKRILMAGSIFLIFILVGLIANGSEYAVLYLFGMLGLLSGVLFLVIDKQTEKVEKRIIDAETEIKSALELTKYVNLKHSLKLEGWSISAHFLNRMIEEIHKIKPKLILECGSGVSSLVIADCLKQLGGGRLISLDHDGEYAKKTKERLYEENLESFATVLSSPLRSYKLDNKTYMWYEFAPEKYVQEKIDMIIVDGPPGKIQALSRYPVVPLLEKYMANKCTIMLDDTIRLDEKKIAELWADHLDASLEINENYRGYALIKSGQLE